MSPESSRKKFRLMVVNTHPIQYFAPLYRRIAESEDIDITVCYCSRQSLGEGHVDSGFGKVVTWDIPLLEGYTHRFLPNPFGDRGVRGFTSIFNPAVVSELRKERPDAVLIHGHNTATALLALATAKFFGIRVFMRSETHLLLKRSVLKRALRRPLMSLFYRMCDACLYIGSRNREFYEAHGVPQTKLFAVPYSVDNQRFAAVAEAARVRREELRRGLGVPAMRPVVLFVSKLIPRKRPADLLLAYLRLRRSGVDATLMFVGEGELRVQLERDAARSEFAADIRFTGFVNQRSLPEYFVLADVFVLPSEDEPWGLILNEVMCTGTPVVAAEDIGAVPDLVIAGETGLTYSAGDIEGLAKQIKHVLLDPAFASRMASDARARVMAWGYDESIAGIRAALEATVGR